MAQIKQRSEKLKSREYEKFCSEQYIYALANSFANLARELSKDTDVIRLDMEELSPTEVGKRFSDLVRFVAKNQ